MCMPNMVNQKVGVTGSAVSFWRTAMWHPASSGVVERMNDRRDCEISGNPEGDELCTSSSKANGYSVSCRAENGRATVAA
jgi:hypothetical protein